MTPDKEKPVAVWCPICGFIISKPPPGCKDFVWVEDVCKDCKILWDY